MQITFLSRRNLLSLLKLCLTFPLLRFLQGRYRGGFISFLKKQKIGICWEAKLNNIWIPKIISIFKPSNSTSHIIAYNHQTQLQSNEIQKWSFNFFCYNTSQLIFLSYIWIFLTRPQKWYLIISRLLHNINSWICSPLFFSNILTLARSIENTLPYVKIKNSDNKVGFGRWRRVRVRKRWTRHQLHHHLLQSAGEVLESWSHMTCRPNGRAKERDEILGCSVSTWWPLVFLQLPLHPRRRGCRAWRSGGLALLSLQSGLCLLVVIC